MSSKGDETKRNIREKAKQLFAEKGFKEVTMKDICEVSGMSRGGLYRHYGSTQQIFAEIIRDMMNAQDNQFSEYMEQGIPAITILDGILEQYRGEMLDGEGSLSVAFYEYFSGLPCTEENILLKQYLYSSEMWNRLIQYGRDREEFRECDAQAVIDLLLFSYQGVRMYSKLMTIDEKIPERMLELIKSMLLVSI